MNMYSFTKEELENAYDHIKVIILGSLMEEGLIDGEKAEEWSESHTVILRKKNIFKTLTAKWKNEEESDGHYVIVVKKVL